MCNFRCLVLSSGLFPAPAGLLSYGLQLALRSEGRKILELFRGVRWYHSTKYPVFSVLLVCVELGKGSEREV